MESIKTFILSHTPSRLVSTRDTEIQRDKRIHFEEASHTYTIDPDKDDTNHIYTSVTTWIHTLFPTFNADKIISNMRRSKNWSKSKYYGMSDEEIKMSWELNRDQAASNGTLMHAIIEEFYTRPVYTQVYLLEAITTMKDVPKEIEYFCTYEKDRIDKVIFKNYNLRPYRTEWTVFDESLLIAGSIDMIYESIDTGNFVIVDWKRCKKIKKSNAWEYATVEPLAHIPNANFWHYTIQLNLYRYIIQKCYNRLVDELWIVCLHPENSNNSYIRYKVPILQDEIDNLVQFRLRQVQ